MAVETVYNGKGERVTDLGHAAPLTGSEYIIVVQGGRTKVISADDIVDLINKTLDGRFNTSYLVVTTQSEGYSTDLIGRVKYQNNVLKGKQNYLIGARQVGRFFDPKNNIDVSYDPGAGSFTVLQDGFVLDPDFELVVWINSVTEDTGTPGDSSAIQIQLDDHQARLVSLESDGMVLSVAVAGQTQFNIGTLPKNKSVLNINGINHYLTDDYTLSMVGLNATLTWLNSFLLDTTDRVKLFKD